MVPVRASRSTDTVVVNQSTPKTGALSFPAVQERAARPRQGHALELLELGLEDLERAGSQLHGARPLGEGLVRRRARRGRRGRVGRQGRRGCQDQQCGQGVDAHGRSLASGRTACERQWDGSAAALLLGLLGGWPGRRRSRNPNRKDERLVGPIRGGTDQAAVDALEAQQVRAAGAERVLGLEREPGCRPRRPPTRRRQGRAGPASRAGRGVHRGAQRRRGPRRSTRARCRSPGPGRARSTPGRRAPRPT